MPEDLPPTFTVIIPTYNRASRLPAAINSVVAQNYEDWELIIIDDGSSDNTKQVCQPFLSDERINYVYQKNKELNGARNTGVRQAKGAYCCFLDDDDQFLPDHLEALSLFIKTQGTNYGIFRVNMKILRGDKTSLGHPFQNQRDSLVQHWESPGNLLPLAINTELLLQQPFDEQDLLLDDFIWLNEALTKTSIFQCDPTTVLYVEHGASRTKTYHSLERLPDMVRRLQEVYTVEGVKERVPEVLLWKRIHHLHLHLAHQLSRQGHRREALSTWWKGIKGARGLYWQASVKSLVKIIIGLRK